MEGGLEVDDAGGMLLYECLWFNALGCTGRRFYNFWGTGLTGY
jgi:hypothetical protein